MSADLRDVRLHKYLEFAADIESPQDVLNSFAKGLFFRVRYFLPGSDEDISPFPISKISRYFFDEDGSLSSKGIPVYAPDLPEDYSDVIGKYIDVLASIKPSERKDSVALPPLIWKERIEKMFPRKKDGPHPCACMPALYVPYAGKNHDFWGIYYNTPILADLFFNITSSYPVTVLSTAHALAHAVSGENGHPIFESIPLDALIIHGWRTFILFWTNFWLAAHILQDIYAVKGKMDDYFDLYDLENLDAFRFAALVALLEKGSFGAQVVARPILDIFRPPLGRKDHPLYHAYHSVYRSFIHQHRARLDILDRVIRLAVFFSAYNFVLGPDLLPTVPDRILNEIDGYWSAFYLAHASGTADPVAVETGGKYRGVRGFVRVL